MWRLTKAWTCLAVLLAFAIISYAPPAALLAGDAFTDAQWDQPIGFACEQDCPCDVGNWWDNTSLLFAADGWRTRADDDYPMNFGLRTGFNTGIGLWDSPIRLQLGLNYAAYDIDGRDGDPGADPISNASVENQVVITSGFYKRSAIEQDDRWALGAVVDLLYDDHFGEEAEETFVRQTRGYVGYALDEANEIGTTFAFQLNWSRYISDTRGRTRVRGLDQVNLFWHHNWEFGGDTWLYAGGAEEPGEWILGLTGQAPLSPAVALYGGFTYVIPSAPAGDPIFIGQNYAEAYWNVSFGFVWSFGCKAANPTVSGYRGMPLLPVADNGSFLIKAPTGDL
jgi:hypothetical protein